MKIKRGVVAVVVGVVACFAVNVRGQAAGGPVGMVVDVGRATAHVSPTLYGLMTEEINFSYDGGLYAELIRNRVFKDTPVKNEEDAIPEWSVVDAGGKGTMALDQGQPLNSALTNSLKFDISSATAAQRVGVANSGYWGIPVKPQTKYRASFYARASAGFAGPLTVDIESNDGKTVFASADVPKVGAAWQQYTVTLTTDASVQPSKTNRFVIYSSSPGTVWFSLVSLFPPTYNDRPNGNRIDLMQMLVDMKPQFLRFPGGNYLEGNDLAEPVRF